MTVKLNIQFERAVRLLAANLPASTESSRKPILFHSIRVGTYLYEHGYQPDIVLAGVLHDAIEWSTITEHVLRTEFGDVITNLVLANTKNDSFTDPEEKITELIQRCVQTGQDALIVKTADILDSFKWYRGQDNTEELLYCSRIINAILAFKPDYFNDPIFTELTYA